MKSRLTLSATFCVFFIACAIALFDLENPGWTGNEKSYLGLIAGLICGFWELKSKMR